MISEDRLSQIAENPDSHEAEVVAMAQELLQLRRTLGAPWAVVQPLGELYVGDGNGAMIWPASLAERGDVFLYRLEKPSPGGMPRRPHQSSAAAKRNYRRRSKVPSAQHTSSKSADAAVKKFSAISFPFMSGPAAL